MKLVIDTNILISALIKPDGKIFDLLENSSLNHGLYLSDFSLIELSNHRNRIIKSSKLSPQQFDYNRELLLRSFAIIPAEYIPISVMEKAFSLVKEIDPNDTVFIATSIFLDAALWTGDKVLYNGLKAKSFQQILNSTEIKDLIDYE